MVFTNGSEVEADLYVDSIKVNGVTIDSTHANVSYDRGSYASGAFDDDIDVVPGQKTLDVEGALRYDAGTYPGVSLLDRTITYDYDNHVSTITENGNDSSFAYDYTGTRIYKSENGINTYYFGSQYEEQHESGQPTKYISYYFQNGQRIAQRIYDGTTYEVHYYHTDHLGSAVRLTDTSGNPVQSIAYAPFGETVYYSGVKDPKFQYTGQELDVASGLYYYGARYYAPEIGRFIQADTILDGLNRYAYCWNNPMNYVDPSGELSEGWAAHATQSQIGAVASQGGWDGSGAYPGGGGGSSSGSSIQINCPVWDSREGKWVQGTITQEREEPGIKGKINGDDSNKNDKGNEGNTDDGGGNPPIGIESGPGPTIGPTPEPTPSPTPGPTPSIPPNYRDSSSKGGYLILGGILIVGTVVEDGFTFGGGISNDPLTLALGLGLIKMYLDARDIVIDTISNIDLADEADDQTEEDDVQAKEKTKEKTGEIIEGSEEIHTDHEHGPYKDGHKHWLEKHVDPKDPSKARIIRKTGPID